MNPLGCNVGSDTSKDHIFSLDLEFALPRPAIVHLYLKCRKQNESDMFFNTLKKYISVNKESMKKLTT